MAVRVPYSVHVVVDFDHCIHNNTCTQRGDITILTNANSTSQSLRSTIAMFATRQFSLKEGDHLRWEIQAKQDKLIIVVRPFSN
jgi:hypothetical protein